MMHRLRWFVAVAVGGYVLLTLGKRGPVKDTGIIPVGFRAPPPPVVVPLPMGFARFPQSQSSPTIAAFARQVLNENQPYGYFETTTINGTEYGALVEPHWDNHVSANYKWHPGVSVLRRVRA